jgi:hypothetical protein
MLRCSLRPSRLDTEEQLRLTVEWMTCMPPSPPTPPIPPTNSYQNFCNITPLVQRPTNCWQAGVAEENRGGIILQKFKRREFFVAIFFSPSSTNLGAEIAQWYSDGLRAGWSVVRVPVVAGNFSLHHRVQHGSGAHPASYPMGTRGSLPGGKAAGAWIWPLTYT